MVLDSIDVIAHAMSVAQDLIKIIEEPITLSSGTVISIGTSIGISQFPDDGDTATLLLEKADMALYEVKRAGRGTYALYRDEG